MENETLQSRFGQLVNLFAKHGVEFIVIGGMAESLYGSARPTYDIDICYRRSAENLTRLADALKQIHPTLRGAPPDLPFILDAKSLALGNNFTFETDLRAVDLLGHVEPLGTFEQIIAKTETQRIAGHDINIIALDDLIRIKEHINRPKDRESLMQLRAIKQVREREGQS